MAGQREELSGVWRLRIHGDRILPFLSEDLEEGRCPSSGWLFCFSDLQIEPQYQSLSFYDGAPVKLYVTVLFVAVRL